MSEPCWSFTAFLVWLSVSPICVNMRLPYHDLFPPPSPLPYQRTTPSSHSESTIHLFSQRTSCSSAPWNASLTSGISSLAREAKPWTVPLYSCISKGILSVSDLASSAVRMEAILEGGLAQSSEEQKRAEDLSVGEKMEVGQALTLSEDP